LWGPKVGYDMLRFMPTTFLRFFPFSCLFPWEGTKNPPKNLRCDTFDNPRSLPIPNCSFYLLDDAVFTAFVILLLSFVLLFLSVADR
jgi:hypothetical protein